MSRAPTGPRVMLVAAVRGLVSEGERVRAAIAAQSPAVVVLDVGIEGLAGLTRWVDGKVEGGSVVVGEEGLEYDAADVLTESEVAYGVALERFGTVRLPPPDLVAAVRAATERAVPLVPGDLSEEEYETVFTKEVGALALLRYSRRVKKLARRPPAAETARALAIAWDARLIAIPGYARVERAREQRIAERAASAADEHGAALVVVDVARAEGVRAALAASAPQLPVSSE
ncbi:MAG: hypothetical protein ACYDCK_08400 [Thermoplasmatota archaeon]